MPLVIKPSYEIMTVANGDDILNFIERCGRVCYKSEEKVGTSSRQFCYNLIKRGHESVIEHFNMTVKFIVDRGVSHEIVRHRLASYSQESTRYCNYASNKFGSQITFIKPCFLNEGTIGYSIWESAMKNAEDNYMRMLELGYTPQEARSVLPNSLKTEVVMTANMREWRHFLKLRTAKDAHPQMREVTIPLCKELQNRIPVLFDDIQLDEV